MANHRQKIEDESAALGLAAHIILTGAGFTCALWLLLTYHALAPLPWVGIVLASFVAIAGTHWGGGKIRRRLCGYESHEGLTVSTEFAATMRVLDGSSAEWPQDGEDWPGADADQVDGANIAWAAGTDAPTETNLLRPASLI